MTEPFSFDFSDADGARRPRPRRRSSSVLPHIRAASEKLLKQKKAASIFLGELNNASALLSSDRSVTSEANQIALKAAAAFLGACGDPELDGLGRVFKLLADNLAGKGDERMHYAKAATAYLLEYLAALPGQARQVEPLALEIAHVLSERGFPFSGKNAGGENARGAARKLKNPLVVARGKTIALWRRRYRRKNYPGTYTSGALDPAAAIFKSFKKKAPFKAAGSPRDRARTATAWWYAQLAENDF